MILSPFFPILAVLAVIVLLWVVFLFNRMIRDRNLLKEAWSGIDVQLKRRADLVPALVEDLLTALDRARDEAAVIVLAGRGRAFCAGHDLKEPEPVETVRETRQRLERIQDVTRRVRGFPGIVIAAVHGYALGAGCEFALGCDLVVAEEHAQRELFARLAGALHLEQHVGAPEPVTRGDEHDAVRLELERESAPELALGEPLEIARGQEQEGARRRLGARR